MVVVNEQVLEMIKNDISLNKISKATGLYKSTLYYHYKKIKGKKYKEIEFNFKNENELGEFLGVFAGDGSFFKDKLSHYRISISLGYYEMEYVKRLYSQLSFWFNKKPYLHRNYNLGKLSCIALFYNSMIIYRLIASYLIWEGKKTYTVRLRKLNLGKKEFNLGFLRGLIDTDGSYYRPKRALSFATTSKRLAVQANKIILCYLGVRPNWYIRKKINRADLHVLTLYGLNSIRLINLINPTNPNKNIR